MTTVKVNRLNHLYGEMENVEITVDDFPTDVLKVDDWFHPQIGELCFNSGKMDIIKDLFYKEAYHKKFLMCSFELSEDIVVLDSVNRIEVLSDKVFIFNGRVFAHQEPLDGGYIETIARKEEITKYEYKFGE